MFFSTPTKVCQVITIGWSFYYFYIRVVFYLCQSILREVLLDEEKGMYERYAALFALRNNGGKEAVAAIVDSLGSKSALLKHEVC